MIQFLRSLKKSLDKRRAQNFTELPSGIKTGLTSYLNPGEEILLTLLSFRAIYRAPSLIDSNTFFNSWLILTSQRIIVAKSSSSFKKFREIPYNAIDRIDYETGALESKLTIHSPGTVDIIEFLRESRMYCEGLDIKIKRAIEEARRTEKHAGVFDAIFCPQCGSKIPKESKFCSECGKSTKILP